MSQVCLEVQNLNIGYGTHRVLNNVDFSAPARQISCIVGPSGCGKTSLLHCLNRINEGEPKLTVNGSIDWQFRDQTNKIMSSRLLRLKVGMIFQKPNPFPVSIYRNLEIPLKEHFRRLDRRGRYKKIRKALEGVGLWSEVEGRLHASALELSGGQQQRLCLARALVLEPEVLLLDEPCSALDPIATKAIEDLLLKLKESMTLIMVTHNISQAVRISDCILVFWNSGQGGFLVEAGPTKHILSSLAHPITQAYFSGEMG